MRILELHISLSYMSSILNYLLNLWSSKALCCLCVVAIVLTATCSLDSIWSKTFCWRLYYLSVQLLEKFYWILPKLREEKKNSRKAKNRLSFCIRKAPVSLGLIFCARLHDNFHFGRKFFFSNFKTVYLCISRLWYIHKIIGIENITLQLHFSVGKTGNFQLQTFLFCGWTKSRKV